MKDHPSEVEIRQVPVEAVYPLRLKVLRPNRTLADCVWAQDTAPGSTHFAAYSGDQVIGIASMAIDPRTGDPPNSWRLRGMATEPAWQGRGIGARVLEACVAHGRQQSGVLIWCNARTSAIGFYRKYGFETVGDEFETPGIGPHFVMIKVL